MLDFDLLLLHGASVLVASDSNLNPRPETAERGFRIELQAA
tara:strand:- start:415 stop:537 length:123 start_codon:yes stop_codon:yes gene_type:complete